MKISKEKYASMYGPTVGDRFRLADTSLIAKIEKDYTIYGEESKFGGGKTIRDGMAQSPTAVDVADLIITNAIIIAFQPNIMPAAAISLMSPPPMALPLDNRYSRYKKALTAKNPMT